MATTLPISTQGARTFPAIPEPSPDPAALAACAFALKKAVEILIALTGTFATTSSSSSGASGSTGLTQAQVLARISIGV